VKTLRSQKLRALLTHRNLLQSKAIAVENDLALARRLAVIMHRIWTDGTEFRWTRQPAAA